REGGDGRGRGVRPGGRGPTARRAEADAAGARRPRRAGAVRGGPVPEGVRDRRRRAGRVAVRRVRSGDGISGEAGGGEAGEVRLFVGWVGAAKRRLTHPTKPARPHPVVSAPPPRVAWCGPRGTGMATEFDIQGPTRVCAATGR